MPVMFMLVSITNNVLRTKQINPAAIASAAPVHTTQVYHRNLHLWKRHLPQFPSGQPDRKPEYTYTTTNVHRALLVRERYEIKIRDEVHWAISGSSNISRTAWYILCS